LGMVGVMAAVMGLAMEEVMVEDMDIARAQALELPVLSRAPIATATIANVRKGTSPVEDTVTVEVTERNTVTVEWKENIATVTIANARTGLGSRARDTAREEDVATIDLCKGDLEDNFFIIVIIAKGDLHKQIFFLLSS